MNINITGRRMEMSSNLQDHARKKIKKLERYFDQLIDAHLIMYIDKLDHGAELIINGDGVQFYGAEKSGDMYSSIDLLMDKMEKQIVKYKEKHSEHKATPLGELSTVEVEEESGKELMLNQVSKKPIDGVEAFLEMKIDKRDFILFKKGVNEVKKDTTDYFNKNYSVIYKTADGYKMLEIPFEMIRENHFETENFIVYDLLVHDDSLSNPKIEFRKNSGSDIRKLSLNEAVKEIESFPGQFLPFFNTDTNYLNVIYKNGKNVEVMVPTF
jgi:putative sigma-54 modulation protein